MENENYYQPYQPQLDPAPKRQTALVVAIGVVVVVAAILYVIISAVVTRQNTGLLSVKASSQGATLEVQQLNTQVKKIGTGSAKVRLKPGDYQVITTDNGATTVNLVTVAKHQTINLNVTIQPLVKSTKITAAPAQNILLDTGQVYFLNTSIQSLSNYHIGALNATPYRTDIYPITGVDWIDATHFFTEDASGNWTYHNGTTTTPLTFGQGETPESASISFTPSGAVAYVTNKKNIVVMRSPGAQPQQIGTASDTAAQASISPDGDVIVSTPIINYNDPLRPTILYHQGTQITLSASLEGIANVVWAPDGSKISYTTNSGIYVYELSTKKMSQVFIGSTTNPLSGTWLNNTTLLYAQDNAILQFQTDKQTSTKLAGLDGIMSEAYPFTIASDGQTVYYGTAPDNKGTGGNVYRFVPGYNSLSKTQQQAIQSSQTQYAQDIANDPLLSQLPYLGAGFEFYVSYIPSANPSAKPTITITAPDTPSQQDALTWIKSQGINTNNYSIRYVTAPVNF